jgi:alkylation response protein AidB-like acyl-CoA dehydrogenase
MDFSMSADSMALRDEVRAVIADIVTPDLVRAAHEAGTDSCPALARELGRRGILERAVRSLCDGDAVDCWVLLHELHAAGIPQDAIAQSVITAVIVRRAGTPEQNALMQPGLLSGEVIACFALTEPDAGSDLAAIKTRATLDGDHWLINGAKMWTTMAHVADWVLLLARSDPAAVGHAGFTMFLFPTATPGFTFEPIWTLSTERSNATFYDDVRVGREYVLGEEHQGWRTLGVMLGVERGVGNTAFGVPLLRRAVAWATGAGRMGDPLVRNLLARVAIDNEVAKLLTQRSLWLSSNGKPGAATAGSETKVFAAGAYQRSAAALQALAAPESLLGLDEPRAAADGWVDYDARHAVPQTIQGGTSEINRNTIAERRLGLRRAAE